MAKFFATILQILLPWALAEYTRLRQKSEKKEAKEEDIEAGVAALKAALLKAQDGKPVTPEQMKELRDAYRKHIRS